MCKQEIFWQIKQPVRDMVEAIPGIIKVVSLKSKRNNLRSKVAPAKKPLESKAKLRIIMI
jgi:hypothetical protein